MKRIILIPTLVVLTTTLTGCYSVMKWYKKASSAVSKNGLYAEIHDDGSNVMTAELSSDFGTEIDKSGKIVPSMMTEFLPTSFNHNDLTFVYADKTGMNFEAVDYQFINNHREKGTQAYYVDFNIRFESQKTNCIVQLDLGASEVKVSNSNVKSGVRMAFLNHTQYDVKPLVWAPNQLRENACYHDTNKEVHYTEDDKFIAKDDIVNETSYDWDKDFEKQKNYKTCMGYYDGTQDWFGISVFVWFEGTDLSITNSLFDGECQVKTNLTFRLI